MPDSSKVALFGVFGLFGGAFIALWLVGQAYNLVVDPSPDTDRSIALILGLPALVIGGGLGCFGAARWARRFFETD